MTNRELTYKFLELPHVIKIDILTILNLMHDLDQCNPDWSIYFKRAVDNNKLNEFKELVNIEHKKLFGG